MDHKVYLQVVRESVNMEFSNPVHLTSFLFKFGNAEHPTDQFYDAVVEVATELGSGNETYVWGLRSGHFGEELPKGA